jgi:predicted GIY-YIG superfamily endonuclease
MTKISAKFLKPIWSTYIMEGDKGLYFGSSSRVEERLKDHRRGIYKDSLVLGNPNNLKLRRAWFVGDYTKAAKLARYLKENEEARKDLLDNEETLIKHLIAACESVKDTYIDSYVRQLTAPGERSEPDAPTTLRRRDM